MQELRNWESLGKQIITREITNLRNKLQSPEAAGGENVIIGKLVGIEKPMTEAQNTLLEDNPTRTVKLVFLGQSVLNIENPYNAEAIHRCGSNNHLSEFV